MLGFIVAVLYLIGALQAWMNLTNMEGITSLVAKQRVVMDPVHKSLAAAVWPVSTLYQLYLMVTLSTEGEDDTTNGSQ